MPFLPLTKEEMKQRGWQECDIVLVTGDAYVDHPSFGTAIISRVLEREGFRVCILSQPRRDEDYFRFGHPKYAFFVNGGNIDSMVAHYTAAKKRRSDDAYTAGGKSGARPDRATIVYCKAIRRLFRDVPIAIGGLEASLRRFAHYDYWDDRVRPSILLESGADLLMYGMGERSCAEIARRLRDGEPIGSITDVRGTAYAVATRDYIPRPCAECPSYEQVKQPDDAGKRQYAKSCKIQQLEHDAVSGKTVIQRHGDVIVVQNPPSIPLDGRELDEIYELPYMRDFHPSYIPLGGVPGIEEVKFSIVHNRGCFGACNFCAIAYHQGREVTARTADSVLAEAKKIAAMPDFKGYIHDVGGPTANFRKPSCEKQRKLGFCRDRRCLSPEMCPAIKPDENEYAEILCRMREIPGIKRVFVRSGVRFDYMINDEDETFFRELVKYHVSGQLKVAPEHCCDGVLALMGKPKFEVYRRFARRFRELTKAAGKEQYLVPYMISSHPGSTLKDAIELAVYLKSENMHPEQVQDFYPTPGTVSTCMFYTGLDPMTMQPVYVAREQKEKAKQRALLQYYRKENESVVRAALREAHRTELIGTSKECLVPPAPYERYKKTADARTKDAKDRQGASGARIGGRKPANGGGKTSGGARKKRS